MTEDYPASPTPRKPAPVVCLACARARREGRTWGCLVHVADGIL